jgi:hypothetical protein
MINKLGIIASAKRTANLLLDTYPADAGYSLRKLRTDYSGYVLKVRREADDYQADVEFNSDNTVSLASGVANLSGGSGATLGDWAGSDTVRAVTWYDQSANSRDITTSTESRQPKLIASGSLEVYNSRVALNFYGDLLQRSDASAESQPNSFLAVVQSDNTSSGKYLVDGDGSGGRNLLGQQGSKRRLWAGGWSGSAANDTNQAIWLGVFAGSSSQLSINGVNATSLSPGSQAMSGFSLGSRYSGSNSWDGYVHEIVHWHSNQSDDPTNNRVAIVTNANDYYSVF